ncbi:ABC transporter ATP-binding protein [Anaerococcus sp. AGMB00486]|uniref:ABC transporter ATP-binding protein n=2 Tax=Anaerococcus TaxID=165779 RepID=A0ABX2N7E1_9FIRM|nr:MULTISPECIES: ABC transporter ATP-binding protein [Anaerococcus]MSS76925.1 ABC transporter ATP-binding protein [Anaerococcus porci]NVF10590.1 ABC transporter ATP-binding protein [Anaerococcus faecalis]
MKLKNIVKNKSINKLKDYALLEKKYLFIGFIFSFLRTFLEILGPMIIAYIINNIFISNITKNDFKTIALLLNIYLIIFVLSGILLNRSKVYFQISANKIAARVQKDVYDKVSNFPISYFDNLPAGKIASRVTNDTNKLKTMFQLLFSDIANAFILAVGLYITLFFTDTIAALMLLILVPFVYIIFKTYLNKTYVYTKKIKKYTADINAKINEYIHNMEIIQVFNKEKYMYDKFENVNKSIFDINIKLSKLRSYSGYRAMDVIQYLAIIIVMLYFGIGSITNIYTVTIGSLYMAIDYTTKIFNNINTIIMRFGDIEDALSSANHIFELLDRKSLKKLGKHKIDLNKDIEFKNIYFAYKENDIIKNLSLKVKSGTSIAFIGQTGSGKSTIINLLLNFYSPRKGTIEIGGVNISSINRDDLRKDMAVVLQDSFLFKDTIRENISMGDDFSTSEIIKALKTVGGEKIIKRGIDSEILENGSNLSQGEKQLISFARAYIRDPKLLILDEATSNIDTETEQIIQNGINKLKKDRTTFIIAHRLSTIKDVDKIIVLYNGQILEEGNHNELMRRNGYYKKMYLQQMKDE